MPSEPTLFNLRSVGVAHTALMGYRFGLPTIRCTTRGKGQGPIKRPGAANERAASCFGNNGTGEGLP